MLNVAYLIGSLNRGGTETLLLDTFRRRTEASINMVLIHRKGGPCLADFKAMGAECYQLAPGKMYVLRYLWDLRKLLVRNKIDVIHAQYWLDCLYAGVVRPRTTKLVLTLHGYFFLRGVKGLLFRIALRLSDTVCFVSDMERQSYLDFYGDLLLGKDRVVYNGIDFSKFDDARLQEPLPRVSSSPRLVMVGNFVRGRSQQVICRVLSVLHEKQVPFEMYFVGRKSVEEPWRYDECKSIVEGIQTVHFLGGRSDVPAILKQMDICVYATHHDTFGIAVAEAIVAGLPTLVNDYPVMMEVTNDGEWATLYASDNVDECCQKLEAILTNLPRSKEIAAVASRKIRNKFSIEEYINNLKLIYNK